MKLPSLALSIAGAVLLPLATAQIVAPPPAAPQRSGARGSVSFQFTENEINDYIRYALKASARPLVVDFDAIERWSPGTVPALLRPVLAGKKSVWIDYRFQAHDGRATFSVGKAYYQSLRLPAFFVSKMIHIVAARQPEKYDTSKPLPFGLREVSTAERLLVGHN